VSLLQQPAWPDCSTAQQVQQQGQHPKFLQCPAEVWTAILLQRLLLQLQDRMQHLLQHLEVRQRLAVCLLGLQAQRPLLGVGCADAGAAPGRRHAPSASHWVSALLLQS
jgi:hypothetical protein